MTEKYSEVLFEKNLPLFERFSPEVASKLKSLTGKEVQFCFTEKGELNLVKNGKFLHSQSDALNEANTILKTIEKSNLNSLVVYGLGLAYYYDLLKDWLHEASRKMIFFFEDDLEIIRRFLETEKATEILKDSQVVIIPLLSIDPKGLHNEIYEKKYLINPFSSFYRVIALPYYWKEREELFKIIYNFCIFRADQEDAFYFQLYENTIENRYVAYAELDRCFNLKSFENILEHFPVLICGAGPSIQNDLPMIKQLEDKCFLIGSSTGMNVLNQNGLYAHFGAAIDPTDDQTSRMKSNDSFISSYFIENTFTQEGWNYIQGDCIFAVKRSLYPPFIEDFFSQNFSFINLPGGISTSNFSAIAASILKLSPVILAGIDLSYPNDRRYPEGIVPTAGDNFSVAKGYSQKHSDEMSIRYAGKETLATANRFLIEIKHFEMYLAFYPQTHFIHASSSGQTIPGMERKSFEDVAKSLTRQFDSWNEWHAVVALQEKIPIKLNEIKEKLREWLKELHLTKISLEKLLKEIRGEWIYKEGELSPKISSEKALLEKTPGYKKAIQNFDIRVMERQYTQTHYLEFFKKEIDEPIYKRQMVILLNERYGLLLKVINSNIKGAEIAVEIIEEKLKAKVIHQEKPVVDLTIPLFELRDGFLKFDDRSESFNTSKQEVAEVLKYYPSGELKVRQFYKRDLLHGPSCYYAPNGTLLGESVFWEGKREGLHRQFFADGNLAAHLKWKNGKREGLHSYYYPNGVLKSLISYKEGLIDGTVLLYYFNGQLKRKLEYKNGKRNGKETLFFLNGIVAEEAEFSHGKPVGIYQKWSKEGLLQRKVIYKVDHETHFDFDEDGKLINQTHLKKKGNHSADEILNSIDHLLGIKESKGDKSF